MAAPEGSLTQQAEQMNGEFAKLLLAASEDASTASASGGVQEHAAAFVETARALEERLLALQDEGAGQTSVEQVRAASHLFNSHPGALLALFCGAATKRLCLLTDQGSC